MATEGSPVRELEKKFEHLCEVCGGRYLSSITYGKCCSDKCRTRRWRLTEKGRACVVRGNLRHKRPDVEKVCIHCSNKFVTARAVQELCSGCSDKASYYATKRYRAKFPEKNRVRDRTNKRINRDKTLDRQSCQVCGNENSETHHYNYDHPLNVNWLCKKHHVELHNRIKEYEKEWQVDFNRKELGGYFKKVQEQILEDMRLKEVAICG